MSAGTIQFHFGNNETLSVGIDTNNDGTFTALTLSQSKTFKTLKGAQKWLAARLGDNKDAAKLRALGVLPV